METIDLKIVSYNLHKGKNIFGRAFPFKKLKDYLNIQSFDIGLFQEVLGNHTHDEDIIHQIEQLADKKWHEYSFARNSIVSKMDHGNAIMSKFPIINSDILDLSVNHFEKRCAIISSIKVGNTELYLACTHLNLRHSDRIKQIRMLIDYFDKNIDPALPIILGGDFNDWNGKIKSHLLSTGNFKIAGEEQNLKTFPGFFPFLQLDHCFYRNLEFVSTKVGDHQNFKQFSDHLPLICHFKYHHD